MDFEQARFNMVEQQVRPWEVLDPRVLELLFAVKREDFVPDAYRAIAFCDMEIPLGHGQCMMAPKLEARIVQELALEADERVLEIGTGSGYLTALLAKRAAHVTSIELYDEFWHRAATRLEAAGIRNVLLKVGDAAQSVDALLGAGEKFDAIVLAGSVPRLSAAHLARLSPGGRLFAIEGSAPAMQACLHTRAADGSLTVATLFETVVAPLINAPQPSRFRF